MSRTTLTLQAGSRHEIRPDGTVEPAEGLSVPPYCPTCATLWALRDANGVCRGLSPRSSGLQAAARAALAERYPGPFVEEPPGATLRIVVPRPVETSHGWTGDAECERCRRPVGTVSVLDSIFGHEEDRRVTEGRYRVY